MRTCLLFLFTSLLSFSLAGQVSYSDDFESYNSGDLIGASSDFWQLWPSAEATDVPVTTAQAASGEKSLAFRGGLDQDVLLLFGDIYTEGTFNMSMDVLVPDGKNAYYNIQALDQFGQGAGLWSLEFFFRESAVFEAQLGSASNESLAVNPYIAGEWVNIGLEVNLTENLWRLFVDGECLGSFANTDNQNQVAALNLFPIDANSEFYVDNMRFSHSPDAEAVQFNLDGYLLGGVDPILGQLKASHYGINGSSQNIPVAVLNDGVEPITSFDITLDNNGVQTTSSFTGTNIATGEALLLELADEFAFTGNTDRAILDLHNINGVDDDNSCNNKSTIVLQGFTPVEGRKVWVEETTGTGCQFCPRGHVFMDYMGQKYPDLFVGTAVHNNAFGLDPMSELIWNDPVAALAPAQPNIVVNRDELLVGNPQGQMEDFFVQAVTTENVFSLLDIKADYDESTRELTVTVDTEFPIIPVTSGRLLVGLNEDEVTGTGSGFAQVNAYSGGPLGPMAGYENLPNPVPAADMVYEDVARFLFTDAFGMEGAYASGETSHTFTTTLRDDWDVDHLNIVAAFLLSSGKVENCAGISLEDARAKTSVDESFLSTSIDVFPNPASDIINVSMAFDNPTQVSMQVSDGMGKTLSTENYGTVSGTQNFKVNADDLQTGIYYLNFRSGNELTSKRVMIVK